VAVPTITRLPDLHFASVEAEGGFAGAGPAFDRLERRMTSLRGRKMYGVVYPGDPVRYLACLLLEPDDDDLDLERIVVPAGRYARVTVREWQARIAELPDVVDRLASAIGRSGLTIDPGRPMLEYYRRQDELHMMLPVLDDGKP